MVDMTLQHREHYNWQTGMEVLLFKKRDLEGAFQL